MADVSGSPKDIFREVVQIGVVVKELDRSIQVLSDVFGIGPFRIVNWPPADRIDIQRIYHGQPGEFTARMAFTELGPVELELIQPLEGESIWADFLEEHGEGIHHIRFNVCTAWANLDTECKVGFTIEVLKALPGTDGRTPQIVDGTVQG
jgi:hypothetical protein